MPSLLLARSEVEEYELPPVCMRCGAPAAGYKTRRFRWCPTWVTLTIFLGILPYFIIGDLMTRRMKVRVPYCKAHQKRPLLPYLVYAGILLALVASAIGLLVVFQHADWRGYICPGGFLAFFAWCIAAAVIGTSPIRPARITDTTITLKGVCEEFIEALGADRRGDSESGHKAGGDCAPDVDPDGGGYSDRVARGKLDYEEDQ
jgi:hypothetical protein